MDKTERSVTRLSYRFKVSIHGMALTEENRIFYSALTEKICS